MQLQRSSKILLATALSTGLVACSSGGDDPVVGPVQLPSIDSLLYKVFSNAGDPRILSAQTELGETLEFFGDKDSQGLPQNLYAVTVDDATGMTLFDVDPQGLPTTITAPSSGILQFDWDVDGQQAVLTAISPSGLQQVNTVVDFSVPLQPLSSGAQQPPAELPSADVLHPNWAPRQGQPTWGMELPPGSQLELPNPAQGGQAKGLIGSPSATVTTSVTGCGMPTNSAQVLTYVFNEDNGETIGVFPAQVSATGQFSTSIPFDASSLANTPENCQSVTNVIGLGCNLELFFGSEATGAICEALASAIASVSLPPAEAQALALLCSETIPLIDLYCAAAGAGAPVDGPSITELLCEAEFVDASDAVQIRVESCIVGASQNLCSEPVVVQASPTSFPILNSIDLGDETLIRSLTLNPGSPGVGVSYVATADIVCILAESELVLSIVGTDGYTDSMQFQINETQGQGLFLLNVPGAAEGVQDVVTATLNMPDGTVIVRTASLVFG